MQVCLKRANVYGLIKEIKRWNQTFPCSFGLTGSGLSKKWGETKDIDFILVVSDLNLRSSSLRLPYGLSSVGWQSFNRLYDRGSIEMFVTHVRSERYMKLEVYPNSIAKRLLDLQEFTLRRLGQGPLREHPTVLKGFDGQSLVRPARIQKRKNLCSAENDSCIRQNGSLYVGVHLERLLLARFFIDDLGLQAARSGTWSALQTFLENKRHEDLPYAGEVENVFLGIKNFSERKRLSIRRLLMKTLTENKPSAGHV